MMENERSTANQSGRKAVEEKGVTVRTAFGLWLGFSPLQARTKFPRHGRGFTWAHFGIPHEGRSHLHREALEWADRTRGAAPAGPRGRGKYVQGLGGAGLA